MPRFGSGHLREGKDRVLEEAAGSVLKGSRTSGVTERTGGGTTEGRVGAQQAEEGRAPLEDDQWTRDSEQLDTSRSARPLHHAASDAGSSLVRVSDRDRAVSTALALCSLWVSLASTGMRRSRHSCGLQLAVATAGTTGPAADFEREQGTRGPSSAERNDGVRTSNGYTRSEARSPHEELRAHPGPPRGTTGARPVLLVSLLSHPDLLPGSESPRNQLLSVPKAILAKGQNDRSLPLISCLSPHNRIAPR